ncbi:MAG: hypothetical protein DWH71_04315 [Planctomycetota bacterium]|jgi:hypothetical protein|nr:MAG: hypothetical protein DWH71_04315 [Planctomycetota bacterium]RLS52932.1 MAG: hypothetical protein DWH92_01190 [Planctomycetota bacterium]
MHDPLETNVNPPKASNPHAYAMLLYRRAVHPEFFGIEARRKMQHGDYEFEGWIFKGGHCVRFQYGAITFCEVVVDNPTSLPDRGLAGTLPCAGEHDHEEKITENITYMTTIQSESLSDHLYLGTYKEMLQHGRDSDSLMTCWTDPNGKPNLSIIDMQRFRNEIHAQSYHLRAGSGLVLRTQSLVQLPEPAPKETPSASARRR